MTAPGCTAALFLSRREASGHLVSQMERMRPGNGNVFCVATRQYECKRVAASDFQFSTPCGMAFA